MVAGSGPAASVRSAVAVSDEPCARTRKWLVAPGFNPKIGTDSAPDGGSGKVAVVWPYAVVAPQSTATVAAPLAVTSTNAPTTITGFARTSALTAGGAR